MKLSMLALPIVAVSLVLGGCGGSRHHNSDSTYDRPSQNTEPPPPPDTMQDNHSNSPGSHYPATGGTR